MSSVASDQPVLESRSDAVFMGFSIWKPVPEMSLSPLGEGGAKRRVRAGNAPSSGPSGHLLPKGEGHEPRFRLILDTSLTN